MFSRFKRLTIPGESFPLSLSLSWNTLYVGDKSGTVHLIDISHDRSDSQTWHFRFYIQKMTKSSVDKEIFIKGE